MRKSLQVTLLFSGVLGFLGGGVYFLDHKGYFNLTQIDVVLVDAKEQHKFLEPYFKQVHDRFEDFRGVSIFKTPIQKKTAEVAEIPWVERVEISRKFPQGLSVEITPKQVFLLSSTTENGLRPVLEDGTLLGVVDPVSAPDVIHLKGSQFVKDLKLRKSAIEFVKSLPVEGVLNPSRVSEIEYTEKEGFWIDLARSDLKIKIGHEPFDVKSARASQVLEYVENRKIDVRVMDANFSKKVVVRLRKAP